QRVTRWQFGHKSAMSAIPLISSWWGRGCRCGKGGAAERHCPGNILCRQPAPVNKKRGLPTLAPSPLDVYVSPLARAQSQAPSFWTATMPPDAHPTDPARTADTAPPPPEIDRDTLHAFLNTLAERGLETILQGGAVPSPDAAVCARGGFAVLIAVFPLPGNAEGAVGLTDCERRSS